MLTETKINYPELITLLLMFVAIFISIAYFIRSCFQHIKGEKEHLAEPVPYVAPPTIPVEDDDIMSMAINLDEQGISTPAYDQNIIWALRPGYASIDYSAEATAVKCTAIRLKDISKMMYNRSDNSDPRNNFNADVNKTWEARRSWSNLLLNNFDNSELMYLASAGFIILVRMPKDKKYDN